MRKFTNYVNGKGDVFISKTLKIGKLIFSIIKLPNGSSIGKHQHLLDMEWYIVIWGGKVTVKNKQYRISMCKQFAYHNCENENSKPIYILSVKKEVKTR